MSKHLEHSLEVANEEIKLLKKRLWTAIAIIFTLVLAGTSSFAVYLHVLKGQHEAGLDAVIDVYYAELEEKTEQLKLEASEQYALGFKDGRESILKNTLTDYGLPSKPFVPKTALTPEIEALALAVATYAESRGDGIEASEDIAWSIVHRAIDERNTSIYRESIAAVTVSDNQFDAMVPYRKVIEKLVWGKGLDYIPRSASVKGTPNNKAWNEIRKMTTEIMQGKRTMTTVANHFWSPSGAKREDYPTFLKYLKPVGSAGRHLLFVDFVIKDGKKIFFTKSNPYNPNKHD